MNSLELLLTNMSPDQLQEQYYAVLDNDITIFDKGYGDVVDLTEAIAKIYSNKTGSPIRKVDIKKHKAYHKFDLDKALNTVNFMVGNVMDSIRDDFDAFKHALKKLEINTDTNKFREELIWAIARYADRDRKSEQLSDYLIEKIGEAYNSEKNNYSCYQKMRGLADDYIHHCQE